MTLSHAERGRMGADKRATVTTSAQRSASASKAHLGMSVSRVIKAVDQLTPNQLEALHGALSALDKKGSSRT